MERFNGRQVRVVVQRAGHLPYMSGLLPKYRGKETALIGKVKSDPVDSGAVTGGTFKKGDAFPIADPKGALGDAAGQVFVGTESAKVTGWRKDRLGARVPETAPIGVLPVRVVRTDGQTISAGSITIVDTPPVAVADAVPMNSSGGPSNSAPSSSMSPAGGGGGGGSATAPLPPPTNPPGDSGGGATVRPTARPNRSSRAPAAGSGSKASGKNRSSEPRHPRRPNRGGATVATNLTGNGGTTRKPVRGTIKPGVTPRAARPGGGRVASTSRGPNMMASLSAQSAYECLLLHQYAVAREKAQQMLASSPNDPNALAVRGLALLGESRDKNFIAASSDLRAAFNQTKGQPGRAASLAALGMASLLDTTNARQREAARKLIIGALDADPTLVLAATTGARFLNAISEPDRAKKVAEDAATRLGKLGSDEAATAAFDVALCYQEIGDTSKGREFMDRFKKQMPVVAALPPFMDADNRLR